MAAGLLPTQTPFTSAILKVASRCNINCTYCYMYHLADQSWQGQPVRMSNEVLTSFFDQLSEYIEEYALSGFHITLHGGEPLMAGKRFFGIFSQLRSLVEERTGATISVSVQTNGLLLNDEWIEIFNSNRIRLGVSLDGPSVHHDEFRLTKSGKGTHKETEDVVRKLVQEPEWNKCFSGVLCVLNPNAKGDELVKYFDNLGVHRVNFLLPDQNFDHPIHSAAELDQLGNLLRDAYVEWRKIDNPSYQIVIFEELVRYFLNGETPVMDMLAGNPISIMTIESSGAIEPLDVFKCCGREYTETKYSILEDKISDVLGSSTFSLQMNPRESLPSVCKSCDFEKICGGGYLPHRLKNGVFESESFFCKEIIKLFSVISHDIQAYSNRRWQDA